MDPPAVSSEVRKRVSVNLKTCPNPLFEKWLQEWQDSAVKKGSDMQYCFGKALKSLRKFPLVLKSGKECGILQHFGNRLCIMLDRKLAEYRKEHPELDVFRGNLISCFFRQKEKTMVSSTLQSNDQHKKQHLTEYVPAYRSGPYALLVTLLKKSEELDSAGYMTKSELQIQAQDLCDSSFTKSSPEFQYTAWSSMSTLVKKGLVMRSSNAAKFSLSDEGKELAKKLFRIHTENCDSKNFTRNSPMIPESSSQELCVSTAGFASSSLSNLSEPSGHCKQCCRTVVPSANKQVPTVQQNVCIQSSDIIFEPGSFDVVLLVDKQETAGGANRNESNATVVELTNSHTRFEVRHLKVGDFTWVCRHRTTHQELVLPYIVERKRMDDLGKSIKDGRFHEQKFRLKLCGIKNVIYLVESCGLDQHSGLPLPTLQQAVVNTQVVDNFTVKRTANHRESMVYLATLTRLLCNSFSTKTLARCRKLDLAPSSIKDDFASLLTFTDFSKLSAKLKNYSVKEMFVKHLLQLHGLSVEKALAIVAHYESPSALLRAYKQDGGENLLAGIRYSALNRRVGPVTSQVIHSLYTSSSFK